MNIGDAVRITHEGDKDDGLTGTILEIRDGRALVSLDGGAGGWYDLAELEPA